MPPGDVAPALVAGLVFMIPIIAILTAHQRKMAELIHGRRQDNQNAVGGHDRMSDLEREIIELKDLVRRQTIALDDLRAQNHPAPPPTEDISTRLGTQ
ncbi:MAG: hypothetical protein JSS66_01050 [Armatimonadetes bacterium]|nr:hypothetical protein [Armatimonadota bacterium]